MRRFLLQMALFLVFGGWFTSASAAWDLTNQVPITKPEGLQDGMVVYFRGQCNASSAQMVLGADFSYTNAEVRENHLFKLVSAGKSEITGEPMFYMQNVSNQKWFSGSTDGWTVDNMEESTPLVIGKASLWTCMEMKVPGDAETNESFTLAEWEAAGGDEFLPDADIFPNSTKIQAWKWRPSQINAADGDALTLGSFDKGYVPGSGITDEYRSISNVWGSAFGYTECWWNTGKTAINPWYAYEAIYVDDPIGDLEGLIAQLKDDDLGFKYRQGTNPGCLVDYSFYTGYVEKYQEAIDFVEGNPTEEGAEQLIGELKAAREALMNAPRVEMTEGFYYIHVGNWAFEQKQQFTVPGEDGGEDIVVGKVKAMYDREDNIQAWNDWYKEVTVDGKKQIVSKADQAAYIFRVTKSEKDPAYWDIQNALTGRFLVKGGEKSVAMPGTPLEIVKQAAPNDGVFGIRPKGSGSGDYYHCAGHSDGAGSSGNLTTWSFTPASTWNFVAVTDQELVDSLAIVMDQKILDNRLTNEINTAENTIKAGYLSLLSSADQLSSNAADEAEGKDLGVLLDDNTSTFFSTSWHSSLAPDEDHYLQANMSEAVNKVVVWWHKRMGNNANRPTKVTVLGEADGAWHQVGQMPLEGDTLPWGTKTPVVIQQFNFDKAYKMLRFVVNETADANGGKNTALNNGHPFFTLSEFRLYNGWNPTDSTFEYRASSMAYREDVKPAYEALQKAVAAAKTVLGNTTEADIEALQAAIKVFDAAYPDTAILDDVISKAEAYYEQAVSSGGDETLLGTYNTESVHEALNTAVEDAKKEYNKETVTRAYIDKHTAAIQQAIDNFVADVNMPKMDTWYFIENRYNGDDRNEDNNPYANLVYASGKGVGAGLKWGGDVNTGNEDATYLWRFIDMGNNTFAVQNFGTGYYMGANRGTSAQYLLSDTAVAFKFAYVAGEQLTLEDANYNPEQKSLRYIHADGSHNVVTWSAAQDSPSSWMFVEVSEDDFIPMMKVTPNGMDIITLPFNVATTGSLDDVITTDPISVYTLASATTNSEGLITEVTLNPIEVGVTGIPAGTPFIAAYPEELVDEEHAGIKLNVDLSMALSTDAKTVNGLVGVLRADTAQVGMGYFEGDTHEITSVTKKPVSISVQSGYINPKLIVNEEAKDGSVVIGIKDGGVLDNIQAAIKDANTLVDVVDMSGVVVRRSVKKADALKGLAKGVYVVGGTKVSVK